MYLNIFTFKKTENPKDAKLRSVLCISVLSGPDRTGHFITDHFEFKKTLLSGGVKQKVIIHRKVSACLCLHSDFTV